MAEDRIKSAMAGNKKSGKRTKSAKKSSGKKPHEVHIRHSENGGYLIRHSFKNQPGEMPTDDKEYHANDMNELQNHLQEHLDNSPEGGGEEEPQGGAPAPGGM